MKASLNRLAADHGLPLLLSSLFALPILIYMGRLLLHRPSITYAGDVALIEMATRHAAHGAQMLGPYSRFGWSHPGPAWFFFLAVPYRLLGSEPWALVVGAGLFHVAVGAALLWICWRQGGQRLVLLMTFLLVVYIRAVDVHLFIYPWNPWALILPMLLLLTLGSTDVLASGTKLLWVGVIGSVLVQTHLGTAPVVGVVAIAIATFNMKHLRARRSELWRLRMLVPVIALLVLWVPPILEQAMENPGNIGLIVNFVRSGNPGHSLSEAVTAAGSQLRRFPLERGRLVNDPVPSHTTDSTVVVLYLALTMVLILWGRRRGDGFAVRLGLLSVLGLLVSIISLTRVTGGILDFLSAWISVLPLAIWLGVGHLALEQPKLARGARMAGTAMAVAALILALQISRPLATGPLRTPDVGSIRQAWSATRTALGDPGAEILVRIGADGRWSMASGLANELARNGWRVAVPDNWLFMFGNAHQRSGRESIELLLLKTDAQRSPPPGGRILGDFDGTTVALVPLPQPSGR